MAKKKNTPISELNEAEKAGMVTIDYILSKFVDVVEGNGVWADCRPQQRLKALELLGQWKKMFVQHKKVDIDIKGVMRQFDSNTLKTISGEVLDRKELTE